MTNKNLLLLGTLVIILITTACSAEQITVTEEPPPEIQTTNTTPTPEPTPIHTPTPAPTPTQEPSLEQATEQITEQEADLPISSAALPAPDNLHPFANALSDFFVNLAPVPEWAAQLPEQMHFSTHAILVDVDGNGTQGMLASKWTSDVQQYLPHSSAESLLVHRLFLLAGNQTRPVDLHNMAVTRAGRLITTNGADGQGASMSAYTLLGFTDGQLTPVKSIMRTAYGHWEYHIEMVWVSSGEDDTYAVNYHTTEFWERGWEQDQPLSHTEFHELLVRYGLNYGANPFIWQLPDETNAILSLTAALTG